MEKVDIIVIGAGVVGLAIAQRLSGHGKEIAVIERHDGFGRETSSRNSEVIHGGMYYPHDSLKARLCVTGRRMLYDLCSRCGIPHRKAGKLIVANHPQELEKIRKLHAQALRNGVEGAALLTGDEAAHLEPLIVAREALFSPETGIVNTHLLMKHLEQSAAQSGATIAYNCTVMGIAKAAPGFVVEILDVDGKRESLGCECVVNAAGLGSDDIAAMAGIDVDVAGYRLHPCKGEYFAVSGRHKGRLSHLVYPAPTPISLGIHAVLGLDGSLRLGPNAFYVDEINYDVDPSHGPQFLAGAQEFLPFIDSGDLRPDQSGIRPKLQTAEEEFRDFIITDESARGLPGLINLIGIESPGLTSCLSIAEMVHEIFAGR